MRVLHVTPTFAPKIGGIETVVDCLARETLKQGVVADIAHVSPGLRFSRHEDSGRTIWRIPLHGHAFFGIAPRLNWVASKYDLLHVHDPQLLSITANVKTFCGTVPAVLSTHGGFRHTKRFAQFKTFHERYLLRRALLSYRQILATGANDFYYFSRFSSRVSLAENGIDFSRFATSPPDHRSIWKWFYWGRIARHKRLDLICRLAIRARTLGYPIELTICGSDFDGTLANLKTLIAEAEAHPIRYLPEPSDSELRMHLAEAGLFVTASEYEGFGLTILEAMSAGLPVIARAISPIDELVSERSGLLLNFDGSARDDSALSAFLALLPERAHSLSGAARTKAENYSWSKRISPFLEAYKEVCWAEAADT